MTTTATVWLGTTLACTECHDHKYDPFTQRDFYRLYAYFNNIPEQGLDTRQGSPVPNLQIPTPEQPAQLATYRRQVAELEAQHQAAKWPRPRSIRPARTLARDEPQEYVWVDDALPREALADGSEGRASWHWVDSPQPVLSGRLASERTAAGFGQHFFINSKDRLTIAAGDKLFAHVYLDPANPPQAIMLQFNDGTWEHRAYWGANKIDVGTDEPPSRLSHGPAARGRALGAAGSRRRGGGPGRGRSSVSGMAFSQFGGHVYWDKAGVDQSHAASARSRSTANWPGSWPKKRDPSRSCRNNVQDAIKVEADKRDDAQRAALRDYFVQFAYAKTRPLFDPLNKQLDELRKAEGELNRAVPITMVMQENPQTRETFVLVRGDFRAKGDRVTRGVPASLPPLPAGAPDNRLGLAQWLVDREQSARGAA